MTRINTNTKNDDGFTLVELLISISIITVLLSVVLYNYGQFNDNLALSSAGQEMAIAIRQAQTYGINVREISVGTGNFTAAYGVYFNPGSNPSNYYIFADTDGNKAYNAGSGCGTGNTECVEQLTLRNGVKITSICDGTNTCPPPPGGSSVKNMTVTYTRPNPDASINFLNNGGQIKASSPTGKVTLTSPKLKTLTVTIESTGQVSVQ